MDFWLALTFLSEPEWDKNINVLRWVDRWLCHCTSTTVGTAGGCRKSTDGGGSKLFILSFYGSSMSSSRYRSVELNSTLIPLIIIISARLPTVGYMPPLFIPLTWNILCGEKKDALLISILNWYEKLPLCRRKRPITIPLYALSVSHRTSH